MEALDVIDQMGRLVLVKEITNARSIINFELINQASGIYFLMLKDRTDVVVASEKVVIQ